MSLLYTPSVDGPRFVLARVPGWCHCVIRMRPSLVFVMKRLAQPRDFPAGVTDRTGPPQVRAGREAWLVHVLEAEALGGSPGWRLLEAAAEHAGFVSRDFTEGARLFRRPPPPPLVLSGHAASLTPYQSDTLRPSPRTYRTRRRRLKDQLAGRSADYRALARALERSGEMLLAKGDIPEARYDLEQALRLLRGPEAGLVGSEAGLSQQQQPPRGPAAEQDTALEARARLALGECFRAAGGHPPPLSRTNWTRLIPRPVLTGHVNPPPRLSRRSRGGAGAV
jgi:hypothetical protein